MKKVISVLAALIMLFTIVPVCFSATESQVFVTTEKTESGNIKVTFWGSSLKRLTSASFFVNYSSDAFRLVKAKEGGKVADEEFFANFPGVWVFGEKSDSSGAAAGFLSSGGVTANGTAVLCEFEFEVVNGFSPNGRISAYVDELFTDNKNPSDDIFKKDKPMLLFEGSFTAPRGGDLNGDGVFDVLDIAFLELYLSSHRELTEGEFNLADVNCDGAVNYRDFYLIFILDGEKIREYDLNGDGVLDVLDLCLFELTLSEHREADEREFIIADANCDGELTAEDYSAVVNAALQ